MASIVRELQRDILNSKKSVTEILRTAKVISAKLGLDDISEWINQELNGYVGKPLPEYRKVRGGTLQILNPARGWQTVGHVDVAFPVLQSVPALEDLVKGKTLVMPISKNFPVTDLTGDDYFVSQFSQQVVFANSQFKPIIEAVKDHILNWTIEMEKRGILGEDLAFNEKEKQTAVNQTFHIQQFTGVLGNVSHSEVQIYNYSSIHQTLKQLGVPQQERNELENIMDALGKATPAEKPKLIEKAKTWVVKNQEFLGASIGLIRKALGLDTN